MSNILLTLGFIFMMICWFGGVIYQYSFNGSALVRTETMIASIFLFCSFVYWHLIDDKKKNKCRCLKP